MVHDGLIVINTHGSIPDGTRAEVQPLRDHAPTPPRKTKRAAKGPLPASGGWKRRTDINNSATIARGLPRKASRRGTSNG